MYYPGLQTLPGVDDRRSPNTVVFQIDEKHVPTSFPMALWAMQTARYFEYWSWFNGQTLNEKQEIGTDGKTRMKYPLGINPVRNFARKHAAILLGEEAFDTPYPLVKTVVTPKPSVTDVEVDDQDQAKTTVNSDDKKWAQISQNIVNNVWAQSNGRALQMENAVLSQFLGGCIFQLSWEPWRKDEYEIPIFIKNIPPDFFLPVWRTDDYFDLLEAFVVYRIPSHVARELYGYEGQAHTYVTYCEHWTRTKYSIYLDGQPISSGRTGAEFLYKDVPNPFGIVPFVYIPHAREGNFYGSSIVEDIRGLVRELNARAADLGDSIKDTVHRKRYTRDLSVDPKPKQLDRGVFAINLGNTNITTKAQPDVWTEDPPVLSDGLASFPGYLWSQLLREGQMGDIAFGEDEGSQRSALTLAFRMWPSTAHARTERTFWTDGLNAIAKMILKMCVVKSRELKLALPPDLLRRVQLSQDWLPQIPRDREQQVNEVVLRFQAGLLSPQKALEMLGDVRDIEAEIELIKDWQTFQASLQVQQEPGQNGESGASGGTAETQITSPIATSGLSAND